MLVWMPTQRPECYLTTWTLMQSERETWGCGQVSGISSHYVRHVDVEPLLDFLVTWMSVFLISQPFVLQV